MVILPVGGGKMKRVSEWWKKIQGVMKTQSFFVILFICIVAVAVTAVYVTTYNRNKLSQEPLSDVKSLDGVIKSDESKIIVTDSQETESRQEVVNEADDNAADQETSAEVIPGTDDVTSDKAAEKEEVPKKTSTETKPRENTDSSSSIKPVMVQQTAVEETKSESWLIPVEGIPGNGFAAESMVYSETLEQWTTHNGMDIKSEFGNDVVAVADGTVKKVYTDSKLGVTVEIDLGDGMTARYSNLDSNIEVVEGQKVKAGDVIGMVGNTALFEIADGDHLHFEVLKDGKNVNPADYVKY